MPQKGPLPFPHAHEAMAGSGKIMPCARVSDSKKGKKKNCNVSTKKIVITEELERRNLFGRESVKRKEKGFVVLFNGFFHWETSQRCAAIIIE